MATRTLLDADQVDLQAQYGIIRASRAATPPFPAVCQRHVGDPRHSDLDQQFDQTKRIRITIRFALLEILLADANRIGDGCTV